MRTGVINYTYKRQPLSRDEVNERHAMALERSFTETMKASENGQTLKGAAQYWVFRGSGSR